MKKRKISSRQIVKAVFFLLFFSLYINIFPPATFFSYLGFYVLLFFLLLTIFKIFVGSIKGAAWAAIFLTYLILRQNQASNLITTMLLIGIFITLEVYFRKI